MNLFKISMIVLLFGLSLSPSYVNAQDVERPLLGVGVGVAGLLDDHKIIVGSIEYRPAMEWYRMRPWIGMELGYDLIYVASGFLAYFKVSKTLVLTPSFGAGLYSSRTDMKLGSPIEFISTIELSHRFHNDSMIGISFGHISNGSLDKKNPGSELLKICYYIPF